VGYLSEEETGRTSLRSIARFSRLPPQGETEQLIPPRNFLPRYFTAQSVTPSPPAPELHRLVFSRIVRTQSKAFPECLHNVPRMKFIMVLNSQGGLDGHPQ
jgi:hypothetical protein